MRVVTTLRFPALLIVLAAAAIRAMPAAPAGDVQVAPEFPRADADGWINSPPLTMSGLRGRVVVLDIWTFG